MKPNFMSLVGSLKLLSLCDFSIGKIPINILVIN